MTKVIKEQDVRFMDISYGSMREIFPKTNKVSDGKKDLELIAKTFSEELKVLGLLDEVFKCLEVLEKWNRQNRQIRSATSPIMYCDDGRYSIVACLIPPDEEFFFFSSLEQFLCTVAKDEETLERWKKVFAKRDAEDDEC